MAEATAGAGAGRRAPDGMGLPARLLRAPLAGLAAKRGALLVWAPVCLGAGIGGYFLLRTEPGALAAVAALVAHDQGLGALFALQVSNLHLAGLELLHGGGV